MPPKETNWAITIQKDSIWHACSQDTSLPMVPTPMTHKVRFHIPGTIDCLTGILITVSAAEVVCHLSPFGGLDPITTPLANLSISWFSRTYAAKFNATNLQKVKWSCWRGHRRVCDTMNFLAVACMAVQINFFIKYVCNTVRDFADTN